MRIVVAVATLVALLALALPGLSGPSTPARPLYYAQPIQDADLEHRTLRELALMRNTIYARAGNPFRKAWLHDYFAAQPWYKPAKVMDKRKLTKVDRDNARSVVMYEAELSDDDLKAKIAPLQKKAKAGQATPEEIVELRLLSARFGQWLVPDNVQVAHRSPIEDFRLLDRQLTTDDLSDLSRRDLRILRNAVYARRGYDFKSPLLQHHFGLTKWYKPNRKYTPALLSDVDNRNVKLIRSVEDSLGGPIGDTQQAKEEGTGDWLFGA